MLRIYLKRGKNRWHKHRICIRQSEIYLCSIMASWVPNNGATKPGIGRDWPGPDHQRVTIINSQRQETYNISDRNNIKTRDTGSKSVKC